MYLEQGTIDIGRKIRRLTIFAYSVIVLIVLVKYNFKMSMNLSMDSGIIILALITFYRGNKFTGDMLVIGLFIILGLLLVLALLYLKIDKAFGGVLYILIPVIFCIVGIRSKIYKKFSDFIESEHRKRSKSIYYIENIVLIIMVLLSKII